MIYDKHIKNFKLVFSDKRMKKLFLLEGWLYQQSGSGNSDFDLLKWGVVRVFCTF